MATYQRPGVYIQETLLPITQPNLGTSDSIAAFVGTSSGGGPQGPTLINSWSQYQSLFGNINTTNDDLAYAVWSFFANGGSQCYVVRVLDTSAGTSASLTLKDAGTYTGENSIPASVLTVTANTAGAWANNYIYITTVADTDGNFDLIVDVGDVNGTVAHEEFLDLSLGATSTRNALTIVNSTTVGSQYVTLSLASGATGTFLTNYGNPTAVTSQPLAGGVDGTGSADYVNAAELMANVDGTFMMNLPGWTNTSDLTSVINWAAAQQNVFVVVDGPKPGPTDTAATMATAIESLAAAIPVSSYAAVYGPWIYVQDTGSTESGALRLTAPGGTVLGQYARNDVTRGIQKAPAGIGTSLQKVINVACKFSSTTLDTLNSKNINVIRSVPGNGFCIMGARTMNTGYPDRYVNVRRTLMKLKYDLTNLTNFAIFENNDSRLWEEVTNILNQYLLQQYQLGVLQGDVPEDAFYVICDDTNNDQSTADAGVLNVQVGVALVSPAEWIIINIGKFDGTTTVSES